MTEMLEQIRGAVETLHGQVVRTPLVRAGRLSERLGCDLFLKLESLQHTGSFKDRGAYIRLTRLSADEANSWLARYQEAGTAWISWRAGGKSLK